MGKEGPLALTLSPGNARLLEEMQRYIFMRFTAGKGGVLHLNRGLRRGIVHRCGTGATQTASQKTWPSKWPQFVPLNGGKWGEK